MYKVIKNSAYDGHMKATQIIFRIYLKF